jgi:hypothetical protein
MYGSVNIQELIRASKQRGKQLLLGFLLQAEYCKFYLDVSAKMVAVLKRANL